MNRPKNPTDKIESRREQPSPKKKQPDAEYERTIPGRRSPDVEKRHERIVNEDEQLKDVNNREDNAQTPSVAPQEEDLPAATQENENERLEAGYDNSEVHPRPPKVN